MKTYYLPLLSIFLLSHSQILAQDSSNKDNTFDMSLQIRPRTEYRNGAYTPLNQGEQNAFLTHNRTRLSMNYSNKDLLKVKFSVQNINIWGQANQVQTVDPTGGMSIYEAYADLKLSENLRTRVGRQMIALDDDRIFGSLDWHPAGRSHDALALEWNKNNTSVITYAAFNQNYKNNNLNVNNPIGQFFTPTDAQPYQHLQLIHFKHQLSKTSYFSILLNNLGYRNDLLPDTKTHNLQTFGMNYFGKKNAWNGHFSSYYQMGKNALGTKKSAYLLSGSLGYQVAKPLNISIGADYLSGDDTNKTDNTSNSFDPLYGTHHKFYGFMDYFYVGNAHKNVGLLDAHVKLSAKVSPSLNLGLNTHLFYSGANIYNNNKKLSSYLGNEWDFTFGYNVMPNVSIVGGYSFFLNTESLRYLKNKSTANPYQDWFWVSLNVNPQILKAKF
ncbi:alginate export family protein [Riemerella anatipestifer]|nr:alginate export family protein [Riemerella anatipestifer]MDY3358574.1 alginate export family protein [Riemerella anatipestifer]